MGRILVILALSVEEMLESVETIASAIESGTKARLKAGWVD